MLILSYGCNKIKVLMKTVGYRPKPQQAGDDVRPAQVSII